ncbi:hypothetical protein ABI011_15140, partial [Enterococcus faecium]|uniref:hypothetical protein n=1 Tax=Enterococcus faecium TaxID=1352 RepID=UPI003F438101
IRVDEQTKRELEAIERYSVPGNFWMHSTGVQQKRSVEDAWAEVRAAEARCRAAVEKLEKAVEEHRGRGTAPAADAE